MFLIAGIITLIVSIILVLEMLRNFNSFSELKFKDIFYLIGMISICLLSFYKYRDV